MPLYLILASSIFIPALTGLVSYRILPKWGKNLTFILLIGGLTELTAYVFAVNFGTNVIVYYFYIAALFVGYDLFFRSINGRTTMVLYYYLAPILLVEYVFSATPAFPSISFFVLAISVLLRSLNTFRRMAINQITDDAIYYVGSVMFYFMACLVYLSYHRFSQDRDVLVIVSSIWNYLNLASNLAFTAVIWRSRSFYLSR